MTQSCGGAEVRNCDRTRPLSTHLDVKHLRLSLVIVHYPQARRGVGAEVHGARRIGGKPVVERGDPEGHDVGLVLTQPQRHPRRLRAPARVDHEPGGLDIKPAHFGRGAGCARGEVQERSDADGKGFEMSGQRARATFMLFSRHRHRPRPRSPRVLHGSVLLESLRRQSRARARRARGRGSRNNTRRVPPWPAAPS